VFGELLGRLAEPLRFDIGPADVLLIAIIGRCQQAVEAASPEPDVFGPGIADE
jgi:hypothetical protein